MSEPSLSDEHAHEPPSDENYSVTPLELFFDLVFVFAFTQVTALLADDLTVMGVVRGTGLLLVMWWAWVGYAWLTNAVPVDQDVRSRIVVFAAMAAGLVMGLAIPKAFSSDGVLFGFAYLAVTSLFVLLYAVATRDNPEMNRAVRLLAPGVLAAPILVTIAGFFDAGAIRAVLWTLAIIITVTAPFVSGTQGWHVRPAHFAERHGLIIIIALGESLVALGLSASEEPQTFLIIATAVAGFAIVAALWWIYFDVVAIAAERRLSSLTGAARNALARDAYSYIHVFMILGIVFLALGLKKSLLHVDEPLKVIPAFGLFGGVALYLLGHIGVRLRAIGTVNRTRVALVVVLFALIPLGTVVPAYLSVSLTLALLVGLIVFELMTFRELRHRVRHH
ncbi:MAG: low temperature requirement protein A [Actinomycetes bacterium]